MSKTFFRDILGDTLSQMKSTKNLSNKFVADKKAACGCFFTTTKMISEGLTER